MEAAVAKAVLDAYRSMGSGDIDMKTGQRLMEVYLRVSGLERDRYGNYLKSDGKTRWHFKSQVVRREVKTEYGWVAKSSTPLIQVGLNLLELAGKTLGETIVMETVAKKKESRAHQQTSRKTKAEMAEKLRQAQIYATKIVAQDLTLRRDGRTFREELKAFLHGRRDTIKVRTDQALEHGIKPDSEFASLATPPLGAFVAREMSATWNETVSGVEYTIRFKLVEPGTVDISIGRSSESGFGPSISATSHRATFDLDTFDDAGDGFLSGRISEASSGSGRLIAVLFMLMSHKKKQGTGTRLLSAWCQIMGAFGIEEWLAQAVGDEGLAALTAWHRKGALDLLEQIDGTHDYIARCGTSMRPSSSRQPRFPGMARGKREKTLRRRGGRK